MPAKGTCKEDSALSGKLRVFHKAISLNSWKEAADLKVEITEANTLYGYQISGGGAIAKFPRFRTPERAQLEAIRFIFSMLSCGSLALSR